MKLEIKIVRCLLCTLLLLSSFISYGQKDTKVEFIKGNIRAEAVLESEQTVKLISIYNKNNHQIDIKYSQSELYYTINANGSQRFDVEGVRYVKYCKTPYTNNNNNKEHLFKTEDVRKKWNENKPKTDSEQVSVENSTSTPSNTRSVKDDEEEVEVKKTIDGNQILKEFKEQIDLNHDSFYSEWSIMNLESDIRVFVGSLKAQKEPADKKKYIAENKVEDRIQIEAGKLDSAKNEIDIVINEFIKKYNDYEITGNKNHKDEIKKFLEERWNRRDKAVKDLADLIGVDYGSDQSMISLIVISIIVAIFVFCAILLIKKRSGKKDEKQPNSYSNVSREEASESIVIRKASSVVLKKQNIDNVVNNPAYFKINCMDFCSDSAVRNIYIKNSCIKDIYNMYAEDLRNPNNPGEDGCMVLGRWIHDTKTHEYDVSLEEIVKPGDDAVFKEYELNFGGKIKLKVTERLRKLRKDTELQYDLTCWVHSHPGLGIFFSNSDSNVQMQLKHPTHPNFLTAIVVDILTPQQEFGIFTFKRDSTINSKNDITKMYSLEELHNWALESERASHKKDEYYNILSKARTTDNSCRSVQLSNSSIIDLLSMTTSPSSGLIGFAHGYKSAANDYFVEEINDSERATDNELLGCLVVGTGPNFSSLNDIISQHLSYIKFVLFYSVADKTVTMIPVTNMQLCMDWNCFSTEKIEDLKIWTRRKR